MEDMLANDNFCFLLRCTSISTEQRKDFPHFSFSPILLTMELHQMALCDPKHWQKLHQHHMHLALFVLLLHSWYIPQFCTFFLMRVRRNTKLKNFTIVSQETSCAEVICAI